MSEQIKSLVERHIPRAYRGTREVQTAVDGIVRDLDGVRANIARQVRSAARSAGVSAQQVQTFLYDSGLEDRPAPRQAAAPAAQAQQDGGLTAAVCSLEATINGLAAFARQHGYRG